MKAIAIIMKADLYSFERLINLVGESCLTNSIRVFSPIPSTFS